MTTTLMDDVPVAQGRKKEDRDRIDLRADPEWIARIAVQAERLGISISAYIRQAVSRQLERDEAEAPPKSTKRK
jgi:hypothetical protein